MKPTDLYALLVACHAARRTVLIEGEPGCGKTTIPKQASNDQGIGYHIIHAPTAQPEDLGLPSIHGDRHSFTCPDWFPRVGDTTIADEGRLIFDETSQGSDEVQKAIANICQERELHGHKLKPGWSVVLTGNRVSDRAGARRILSQLANRVTRVTLEVSDSDWRSWGAHNGVRPEVLAFSNFRPDLLSKFDPAQDSYPTPRSWTEGVSDMIDKVPSHLEHEAFAGAVGQGAAAEFAGFLRIFRELPDPEVILRTPDTARVPTDPSTLYAVCGAISHRATPENFEAVMTYALRMPPEFAVMVVRDATDKDKTLLETEAFIDWARKHGKLIM